MRGRAARCATGWPVALLAWAFFATLLGGRAQADEPVSDEAGAALSATYRCVACHQPYDLSQGPTWHAVAEKYSSDPHALEDLETSILNGSSGVWGNLPMAPNPVPEGDLKRLVEWILSQR